MADPKAKDINSVADLEKAFPGQIDAVSLGFGVRGPYFRVRSGFGDVLDVLVGLVDRSLAWTFRIFLLFGPFG